MKFFYQKRQYCDTADKCPYGIFYTANTLNKTIAQYFVYLLFDTTKLFGVVVLSFD